MLEQHSIINWIIKYKLKTEDGTPYTFDNHMFMFDVLRDLARRKKNVVVYKAAQIGFSTAAVLATLWIAKNKGIDIIYTLPTATDVKDFAGGKINRIIAQNPILKEWVKGHDTIEQKNVGDNIIYYRGTFTQKSAMMVSSSLNAYDEVDASDQAVIEQYATRLQASEEKTEWFFSHPSLPGNGVSRHWEKSDQRHWFIRCKACEKEQYLNWPESFDMEKEVYQCKECYTEMDKTIIRKGRWIAKYKDREMIGFWIPLFICPWVSAAEIIKLNRDKSAEYFTNKVIGKPYVGRGNKPMVDMINNNLTDVINTQEKRIVIGCDTGLTQYYVIGNEDGLFHYGKSKGYDEIEGFLKRWPRSIVVFDAGGDLVKPRELRDKYIGRIFLCHYSVDRKTMQLIRWGKGDEEGSVNADRNRLLQLTLDEFTDGRIPLQGKYDDWHDYWLHWNNIYRVDKENKLGILEKKWERAGADHWVHATAYWRIGMNRFGTGTGEIISGEGFSFGSRGAPYVNPDSTINIPTQIIGMKAFK